MAGDWIKIEHVTPDKPEVIAISDILKIDQDAVFGKLCRIWIWMDEQSVNGHALSVTENWIDRETRVTGFAEAMRTVGWLGTKNGSLFLPNFDRHNGESAKKRSLDAKRQSRKRHADVTKTSRKPRDQEKRREEYRKPPKSPKGDRGNPCAFSEFSEFCQKLQCGGYAQEWWDYYQRVGWQAARDWQAAVRARAKDVKPESSDAAVESFKARMETRDPALVHIDKLRREFEKSQRKNPNP
jgi:hypothetical protein